MTQQTRTLAFVAFSILVLVLWQQFVIGPRTPKKKSMADAGTPAAQVTTATPGTGTTDAADAGTAPVAAIAPDTAPPAPPPAVEEQVEVETDRWSATFSSKGAGPVSFELKGQKHARPATDGKAEAVNLVRAAKDQPVPLSFTLAPVGADGKPGAPLVTTGTVWQPAERGTDALTWRTEAGGLSLQKRLAWKPGGTDLALDLTVTRAAGAPTGPLQVAFTWPVEGAPQTSGSFFAPTSTDILRPACHLASGGHSVETHKYDEDEPVKTFGEAPDWVGMDERYFLAALAPRTGLSSPSCALAVPTKERFESRLLGTVDPAPGEPTTVSLDLYLGPKDMDQLKAAGHGLDAAVDYGTFGLFAWPLVFLLKLFQGLVGNWGLAIVLLTVTVKLVTLPLTNRQMRSMEEMRRLGPQLEELKKKYGGDQQKLNLETMNLYKEHGVQPLGGCLPMLVQMPVWFALYATLQTSFELYNEPFITGWIGDLTSKDPYYVLPIAMVITMVVTQVLTPTTGQTEQMKTMMYVMPVVFGLMMLSLPAGLVLYIFTNNLLSIAHTTWFRRTHRSGPTTPAPKAA